MKLWCNPTGLTVKDPGSTQLMTLISQVLSHLLRKNKNQLVSFPGAFLPLLFLVLLPTSAYATTVLDTTPGAHTWIAPTDVTSVLVETWAGGGGGGGAGGGDDAGAGGGAGGGYAAKTTSVTPGTVYNYYVGAGGTGGGVLVHVRVGEDSWFKYSSTVLVLSKGGGPGASADSSRAGGVAVTTGAVGTTVYNGGNGAAGVVARGYSGGGGGGAGSAGNGGAAVTKTAGVGGSPDGGAGGPGSSSGRSWFWGGSSSSFGSAPGGGGGGAYTTGGSKRGGAGAGGQIRLTYTAGSPAPNPPGGPGPGTTQVSGYGWSDTVGWIDLAPSGSGVVKNDDGTLAGYAWSDNIGWVKFGGLSGFPSGAGTQAVNAQVSGGNAIGWARACAGTQTGNCSTATSRTDGWDGWISLGGTNYDITYFGGELSGYAWGSDVVGWIQFGAGLPPAPASLTATPGACGSYTVNLSWEPPTGVNINDIAYYIIKRTGGYNEHIITAAKSLTLAPDYDKDTDPNPPDTGLWPGGAYDYGITAYYTDGTNSAATLTNPRSIQAPFLCPPPEDVSASAACVPSGNKGDVTVTWLDPDIPANNGLQSYVLNAHQNSREGNVVDSKTIPFSPPYFGKQSRSSIFNNLDLGTYHMEVLADYQSGDSSGFAAPVTVRACTPVIATCSFTPQNIATPYPVVGKPVTLKVDFTITPGVGPYSIDWTGTELDMTSSAPAVSVTNTPTSASIKKVYSTVGKKEVIAEVTDTVNGTKATCGNLTIDNGPNVRVRPVFDEY